MVAKRQQVGRGRPSIFSDQPKVRRAIGILIKHHGLTRTQEILKSATPRARKIRKELGVPLWNTCNLVTLGKIKKEFGIRLFPGRPTLY